MRGKPGCRGILLELSHGQDSWFFSPRSSGFDSCVWKSRECVTNFQLCAWQCSSSHGLPFHLLMTLLQKPHASDAKSWNQSLVSARWQVCRNPVIHSCSGNKSDFYFFFLINIGFCKAMGLVPELRGEIPRCFLYHVCSGLQHPLGPRCVAQYELLSS